jgi:hypothetical protein
VLSGGKLKFAGRNFLDEANEEADMRKFLILTAAAAALGLFAMSAPADAANRKASGVTATQAAQMDLSARRYRRHYRRYYYYRRYYRPYYYYPYPYYKPYYYPYRYYPYYYRRPGVYFYFGF